MGKNIGIIGLGRIGMPVSQAYLKAGFNVYGYDINSSATAAFSAMGGYSMDSAEEVASKSDVVLILVLNDEQVLDTIEGDQGILKGIKPTGVMVCMSTINRPVLEKMAEKCRDRDIEFIDCPFTGGPARIPDASLTLMAAAPDDLLERITPVLNIVGNITKVGELPGLGQAVKHCNQLLVGITHAATMEVITLARQLHLDPELVCKVVGKGIAGSDYFHLLAESVLFRKPSPGGLGQMCKDVSIVKNTAHEVNFPAYVVTAAAKYFSMAEKSGMQNLEGAALIDTVQSTVIEDN